MPGEARVLLCTSNGVGLGHVTRMMAIARSLQPGVDPVIFTLSAAVAVPVAAGFNVEHMASHGQLGMSTRHWHELLDDRIDHLVRFYRPRVVLFDGVHPYAGLVAGLTRHRRRVVRVWQRRAMWRTGVGVEALTAEHRFDHVVEPGEYAAEYDRGATVSRRAQAHVVNPIVYDDGHLERAAACAQLGLDPTGTNVLVQLGAGAINDVSSLTGAVVSALRAHDGLRVVVARSELSADGGEHHEGVTVVRRFPISRWFAAFDAAVLAAGYNSFHEALARQVPTLFVPNLATRTDDQDARTRFAADRGLGLRWDGTDPAGLAAGVGQLADASARAAIRTRLQDLAPADGAEQVAALVRGWL